MAASARPTMILKKLEEWWGEGENIYLSISIHVYLCLSMPIYVHLYLSLSISIYRYLSISISIYLSLPFIFNAYTDQTLNLFIFNAHTDQTLNLSESVYLFIYFTFNSFRFFIVFRLPKILTHIHTCSYFRPQMVESNAEAESI